MDITDIKSHFPIFANHPDLVYLDNAASTQKPVAMINALTDFYGQYYANVHRGLYPLSIEATKMYEDARATLARFLGADTQEIVFNSGATDGLNLLASSLINSEIVPANPKVLLSDLEHHSNLLPWQQVDAEIDYLHTTDDYVLEIPPDLSKYDIISITHISNVTGALTDIKLIRERAPQAIVIVDAAQSAAHLPVDVKELDIDFLVLAGHKLYGPTGVGVMYGKAEIMGRLQPVRTGGGMVSRVEKTSAKWKSGPEKFEAGTPPIAEAIGLAATVEFLQDIGMDEIRKHEQELTEYAATKLREMPGLKLYHPQDAGAHAGVLSFSLAGTHSHDLSDLLGERGVAVRAGHHCSQILHRDILQVPATTRASIGIYNSSSDIDKLVSEIKAITSHLNT